MNFSKLAFSLRVLRSAESPRFVKKAGPFTRLAMGAGRMALGQIAKHQGILAPVALAGGALATGAAVNNSINKTQSNMAGFDPRVVQAKREMGQ